MLFVSLWLRIKTWRIDPIAVLVDTISTKRVVRGFLDSGVNSGITIVTIKWRCIPISIYVNDSHANSINATITESTGITTAATIGFVSRWIDTCT